MFNGAHCLVNRHMIEGTGLEEVVNVANSAKEFKTKIAELSMSSLEKDVVQKRKDILFNFSNELNINRVVDLF